MLQNFHVMFKGYGDKTVFHREEDYLVFLRLVKRACEKYQIDWLAYALMSNHIHLVVHGNGENLRCFRYNISSGYAAYYRRAYPDNRAPGEPVFRSHNATKWLQANNDLKQVIRYVHRNLIEKGLETSLGEKARGSYSALLAARIPENSGNPTNPANPFHACDDLREIRDALNADAVFRAFGKNHSEQLQNFISFHQISAPTLPWVPEAKAAKRSAAAKGSVAAGQLADDLQRAEMILKQYFSRRYFSSQKEYNTKNRQAFLSWLGRRGNTVKVDLVLQLATETQMSSRQIAEFLQLGSTTVKKILREHRK